MYGKKSFLVAYCRDSYHLYMSINPIIKVEENITETYTLNSQITKIKVSWTF